MGVAVEQWEHFVITSTGAAAGPLRDVLTRLGAEGWEAVAIAGTDKTLGLNALVVVLKRRMVPPPPLPEGTPAEWYPDPCGRWEKRHWDGRLWTAHVANIAEKTRGVDAPQTLPAPT